jgi:hypothetical protein
MSNNPYAPPSAPVSEIAASTEPRVRPPQVLLAVRILWAMYALGFIVQAYDQVMAPVRQSIPVIVLGDVFGLLIALWIYGKILRGRNWARILVLIGVMLLPFSLWLMTSRFMPAPLPRPALILMFVRIPVDLYVLWLLFLSPGKSWFAARPKG